MANYGIQVSNSPLNIVPVTISNGTSLSAGIDLSNYGFVTGIVMPAAWDAANLTFQSSHDNSTWNNVYDDVGTEYTVTAAASRRINTTLTNFIGIRFLKVRSGTSGTAVNQTADRVLQLVCLP